MVYAMYTAHVLVCYLTLLFGSCFVMIKIADELKEDFGFLNESKKSAENLKVIVEEPEQESVEEVEIYSKKELPKVEPKEDVERGRCEKDAEKNRAAKGTTERYKQFIETHAEVKE